MCTCGSLPDHDECSRCALPPAENTADWYQPDVQANPSSGYEEHDPF
ncbi:hypothetical protein [Streptomyces sp. NPDC059604]